MKNLLRLSVIVVVVVLATAMLSASFSLLEASSRTPITGSSAGWGTGIGPGSGSQGDGSGAGSDGQAGSGLTDPGTTGALPVDVPTMVPVPTADPSLAAVPREDTVTRILESDRVVYAGLNFSVYGEVTGAGGKAISGPGVAIYVVNNSTGEEIACGSGSVNSGAFTAACVAPAAAGVGETSLIARMVGNRQYRDSNDRADVKVMAETVLAITAPADTQADEEFPVSVTLIEKYSRKPVPDASVELSAGLLSHSVTTDSSGKASARTSFSSSGNRTIHATYAGDEDHTASSGTREIAVTEKPLAGTAQMLLGFSLASFFAQLLLSLAAAACLIVGHRLAKRGVSAQEIAPPLPPAALPLPDTGFSLGFPAIESPLPPVWGVGEPLNVCLSGPPGPAIPVRLYVDGRHARDVRLADGRVTASLELAKGAHRITAMAGDRRLAEAVVDVVDYREEIVRMFNDVFALLKKNFDEIREDATPREMQWIVVGGMPEAKHGSLDRLVSVFEVANYSLHSVGRTEYIRSYISIRELSS